MEELDKQTEAEQLTGFVRLALRSLGHAELADLVRPGNTNFAHLPSTAAFQLRQFMILTPTTSHTIAWQARLKDSHFAVKLYEVPDIYWHITVVTTGWRHFIDALIFHHTPRRWRKWRDRLNLRNARAWFGKR